MGCLCSCYTASSDNLYNNINDLERKIDFEIVDDSLVEVEENGNFLLNENDRRSDDKEVIKHYFAGNGLKFGTTKGKQLSSIREKKILSTKL